MVSEGDIHDGEYRLPLHTGRRGSVVDGGRRASGPLRKEAEGNGRETPSVLSSPSRSFFSPCASFCGVSSLLWPQFLFASSSSSGSSAMIGIRMRGRDVHGREDGGGGDREGDEEGVS